MAPFNSEEEESPTQPDGKISFPFRLPVFVYPGHPVVFWFCPRVRKILRAFCKVTKHDFLGIYHQIRVVRVVAWLKRFGDFF